MAEEYSVFTYNVITLLIVLGSSRGNNSCYKTSTLKGLSQRTLVGQPLSFYSTVTLHLSVGIVSDTRRCSGWWSGRYIG